MCVVCVCVCVCVYVCVCVCVVYDHVCTMCVRDEFDPSG